MKSQIMKYTLVFRSASGASRSYREFTSIRQAEEEIAATNWDWLFLGASEDGRQPEIMTVKDANTECFNSLTRKISFFQY